MTSSNEKVVAVLHQLFSDLSIAFNNAAKELVPIQSGKSYDVAQEVDDSVNKDNEVGQQEEQQKAKEPPVTDNNVKESKLSSTNDEPPNYLDMLKGDLRSLCIERGLPSSGTKFDLVTHLVAYDTAYPNPPSEAIKTYTLKFFERQSRSSMEWNPKCHSGQGMSLFLYICENRKGKKYIIVLCQCKKQCLCGRARSLASTSETDDDQTIVDFFADDTNQMWKNYVCRFRAGFKCSEDADTFRHSFDMFRFDDSKIIKKVNGKQYEDNDFQSQNW